MKCLMISSIQSRKQQNRVKIDEVTTKSKISANLKRTDFSEQFGDFFFKLSGCVDRHAPLKKLTPKELKTKSKPWITPDIVKMINLRNKFFKRKKTTI